MTQSDFNPFVDEEDEIEDSVIASLPNYTERVADDDLLASSHRPPTLEELADELPEGFNSSGSRLGVESPGLPRNEYLEQEALEEALPDLGVESFGEPAVATATELPEGAPRFPEDSPLSEGELGFSPTHFHGEEFSNEEEIEKATAEEQAALESTEPLNPTAGNIEEAEPAKVPFFPGFDFAAVQASIEAEEALERAAELEREATESDAPQAEDDLTPPEFEFDFSLLENFSSSEPEGGEGSAPAEVASEADKFAFEPAPAFSEEDEDDEEDWGFAAVEADEPEEAFEPLSASPAAAPSFAPAFNGEDEEEGEEAPYEPEIEDDFVPPANPFASVPEPEEDPALDNWHEAPAAPAVKKKRKKLFDFEQTWANIKSELRGGDSSNPMDAPWESEKPPKNILTGEDNRKKREPGEDEEELSSKLKGALAKLFSPYTKLSGFIGGLILAVLGFLGKLPLVGKPFSALASKGTLIARVAAVLPVLLLVGGLFMHGNSKYGPTESTLEFPDGGKAVFSGFSYDRGAQAASGEINNVGEVVADVKPVFTVYAITPSLNPLSFFYPKPVGECSPAPLKVAIGDIERVTVTCDANIKGFRKKVSGELLW